MSRFLIPVRAAIRLTNTRIHTAARLSTPLIRFTPAAFHTISYRLSTPTPAATQPLQQNEVVERVLNVVKKFEKIKNPAAVTATASFATDLGLDSLDAVEVVMAFEDEFGIEIPDADADKIQSTADAIKYIAAHPKAQ